MSRNAVYVRVLLALLAMVVLLAFFNRSSHRTRSGTWLPSSYNPASSGTKAFYDTLHDLNWPVARWREPLSRLNDYGTGNALLITRSREGWRVSFSEQEGDLLDAWVSKGNTLLLFGAFDEWEDSRDLLRRFGFTLPEGSPATFTDLFRPWEPETGASIAARPFEKPGQPSQTLILPRTPPLPLGFPPGTQVLYQDGGQPYAMQVPRGAGRVIYVASAQILGRNYVEKGDNLAIVLGLLAPDGHVPAHLFFEESHHGYSAIYAMARLLDDPGIRFAGLLALLGGLTFVGSALLRFGPITPLEREAGRSSLEFIDSIAELYHRADLRNEVVRQLFEDTNRAVLHRLNLPANVSQELVASRMQQAFPHLPSWKKLARRFDSPEYVAGLPPGGWFRVTRELIQIKTAMA